MWLLIHLFGLSCSLKRVVVFTTAIAPIARNSFHHKPNDANMNAQFADLNR
jgi:hypothetical protein